MPITAGDGSDWIPNFLPYRVLKALGHIESKNLSCLNKKHYRIWAWKVKQILGVVVNQTFHRQKSLFWIYLIIFSISAEKQHAFYDSFFIHVFQKCCQLIRLERLLTSNFNKSLKPHVHLKRRKEGLSGKTLTNVYKTIHGLFIPMQRIFRMWCYWCLNASIRVLRVGRSGVLC